MIVAISIAPVELFIESHNVFAAFCLHAKKAPLVIEFTMIPEVEFSPKRDLVAIVSTAIVAVLSAIFIGVV